MRAFFTSLTTHFHTRSRLIYSFFFRNFTQQLQKISNDAGMPIIGQPCFCKLDLFQIPPLFNILSFLNYANGIFR